MSSKLKDKLLQQIKDKFYGVTIDKVVLKGADRLLDAGLDFGIDLLQSIKDGQVQKGIEQEKKEDKSKDTEDISSGN
jgi:hypothetical protein